MCVFLFAVDSAFLEGVKKVFNVGNEQKELVDPYFVFSFAGKEVIFFGLKLNFVKMCYSVSYIDV